MPRIEMELALLRTRFPDLVFEDPWILLPTYPLPKVGWSLDSVKIAFPIPPGYPGQKPYGFHSSPPLRVGTNKPGSTTDSAEPPFPGPWLKFSWDCPDWASAQEVESGSNLLHWALSFHERLTDYS